MIQGFNIITHSSHAVYNWGPSCNFLAMNGYVFLLYVCIGRGRVTLVTHYYNICHWMFETTGTPTIPTTGVWPATSSVNDMVTGSWSDDSEESEGMDNTASSTMASPLEF